MVGFRRISAENPAMPERAASLSRRSALSRHRAATAEA